MIGEINEKKFDFSSVGDDGGDANGASDESRRVSRRKKTKVEYKEIDEKKDVSSCCVANVKGVLFSIACNLSLILSYSRWVGSIFGRD